MYSVHGGSFFIPPCQLMAGFEARQFIILSFFSLFFLTTVYILISWFPIKFHTLRLQAAQVHYLALLLILIVQCLKKMNSKKLLNVLMTWDSPRMLLMGNKATFFPQGIKYQWWNKTHHDQWPFLTSHKHAFTVLSFSLSICYVATTSHPTSLLKVFQNHLNHNRFSFLLFSSILASKAAI